MFDFLNPPPGTFTQSTGEAGRTVAASTGNFPALVGTNSAMTIGYLGPCALNAPHTHPRATEINFSVNQTFKGGFISENGARFVSLEFRPNQAVIFPQGVIHFEFNDNCEPGMFVASFNHEDPGVQQTAQRCKSIVRI